MVEAGFGLLTTSLCCTVLDRLDMGSAMKRGPRLTPRLLVQKPLPVLYVLSWGTPEEEQVWEAREECGLGQSETEASLGPTGRDVS